MSQDQQEAQKEYQPGVNPFVQSPFSLKHRALRAIWGLVWLFLFRPSPRPCHSFRRFLLGCFGAKIAKDCHIYPGAKIWAPWNLEMHSQSSLADNVICYCMEKTTLGTKAVVSQGAHLCCGSHNYNSANFELYAMPITVNANAWVCAESFIMPGVTIGEGAVVGARAVVCNDVEPWTIVAGNPANVIKKRALAC